MTEPCEICGGPVNPFDMQTWKQVTGWVGGPRKDSMRLRTDTNKYAHDACVAKAQAGIDPKSQPTLEDDVPAPAPASATDPDVADLFAPVEEVPHVEPDFSGVKFDSDGPAPF